MILAVWEMHPVSFRIWTGVVDFVSYDDNRYITSALFSVKFNQYKKMKVWVYLFNKL